jgi:hypothetical protein
VSAAEKKSISLADLQSQLTAPMANAVSVVDAGAVQGKADNVIVAAEGLGMGQILDLSLDHQARHVCQVQAGAVNAELNSSAIMLKNPQLFLDYPVGVILSPTNLTPETNRELTKLHICFRRTAEKMPSLEHLRELLVQNGRTESLIADAVLIADELFTNAIFNAPFVDLTTGHNPGIDRSDETVEIGQGYTGELLAGFDDERLVIACRDPYGSLNVEKFLIRVRDCCRKGVSANMRAGCGGAGIGSFMVFNASSSLYIGVQSGKCTVVAAVIHWKWNTRKRSEALKNLHYFQL